MFGTFLGAIFGRDSTPIAARSSARHRRWDAAGRLTAFEAYTIAEIYGRRVDADVLLVAIANIGSVDPRGRAAGWVIDLHFPVRQGTGRYTIGTRFDAEGGIIDGIEVEESIAPLESALQTHSTTSGFAPVGVIPVPFIDSDIASRRLPHGGREGTSQVFCTVVDQAGRTSWRICRGDDEHIVAIAA